jgi:hypothetical protein
MVCSISSGFLGKAGPPATSVLKLSRAARLFDLDHFRAEIAEHRGAKRPRD